MLLEENNSYARGINLSARKCNRYSSNPDRLIQGLLTEVLVSVFAVTGKRVYYRGLMFRYHSTSNLCVMATRRPWMRMTWIRYSIFLIHFDDIDRGLDLDGSE